MSDEEVEKGTPATEATSNTRGGVLAGLDKATAPRTDVSGLPTAVPDDATRPVGPSSTETLLTRAAADATDVQDLPKIDPITSEPPQAGPAAEVDTQGGATDTLVADPNPVTNISKTTSEGNPAANFMSKNQRDEEGTRTPGAPIPPVDTRGISKQPEKTGFFKAFMNRMGINKLGGESTSLDPTLKTNEPTSTATFSAGGVSPHGGTEAPGDIRKVPSASAASSFGKKS